MELLKPKEQLLLSYFRQNARSSLTRVSRTTHVPVSTIFDKLRQYERQFIKKHATLLDFSKLGYMTRANVMLKVALDHRKVVQEFLLKHRHVNSLYKINNGFDFQVELIFQHVKDLEDFLEELESMYSIKEKSIYYIIEDICREEFLANPEIVGMEA